MRLPVLKVGEVKDFFRVHPSDDYYSGEYSFVHVPIKGQKGDNLHLIDAEVATSNLNSGKILNFGLVLASKPNDVFFMLRVPTQNLDNGYNRTASEAIELAKERWVEVTSRKAEGQEDYKIEFSRHPKPFPEPEWPTQTLNALIEKTYAGRIILDEEHPALKRLLGIPQDVG